jgi:gluconokinase
MMQRSRTVLSADGKSLAGVSLVVMGVCGCGKSSVGAALAGLLGAKFIDGDDLHPRANILKMACGEPLDDDDRSPWLERIGDACFSLEHKSEVGVIACSALKQKYRAAIAAGNKRVFFLWLDGSIEVIQGRLNARRGHFMAPSLLASQFVALESPADEPNTIRLDVSSRDGAGATEGSPVGSVARLAEQAAAAVRAAVAAAAAAGAGEVGA